MKVGKDTSRNTRPVMAGLKMFCPMPPKVILATAMATTAPMNTTHRGQVGGRFMASRIPVTMADRSPVVEAFLRRYLVIAHSSTTQEATLNAIMAISLSP